MNFFQRRRLMIAIEEAEVEKLRQVVIANANKWLDTMATQWIKEEANRMDRFGRPVRFPKH